MNKEIPLVWYNPDEPWQQLIFRPVFDGKNEVFMAIGKTEYFKNPKKPGLVCTEIDLYRWGWKPVPDIELAKAAGFKK